MKEDIKLIVLVLILQWSFGFGSGKIYKLDSEIVKLNVNLHISISSEWLL